MDPDTQTILIGVAVVFVVVGLIGVVTTLAAAAAEAGGDDDDYPQ